jgi:hypothetical protein
MMQIRRRENIDPEEGIRKYGRVEFADQINNKYPIDTPEHIRAAWNYINLPRNAIFYSIWELQHIKNRIMAAAKQFEIELSEDLIERDAKLFTSGNYPDRGIEITESDLDRIVESHSPVPIKVEHTDTPLELGLVTKIWRIGKDLFGKLSFTAPAWALIQSSGAKKLSAAVKRDKSGLAEVSIVRSPRIAGAAIFNSESVEFTFEINNGGGEMSETQAAESSKRISELERELRGRDVDTQIDSLKRMGKLTPVSEDLARAILMVGESQVVTFSDGTEKPVAETFFAFLESQPKVVEFSELAEGAKDTPSISEEEQELYAKLGISPETAAKYRKR